MKESARYLLPILFFVAVILTIGTVGYLVIEDDISVNDAFYMAITAITPTQFEEVHELSVPGRYFTVLLVFCGFGAVVAFATQFARLIIQSELEGVGVITRKQMRRRIRRMKNHYIVCGYGEIGSAICGELEEQQIPFVVIADDEPSMSALNREGYAMVNGNPTADISLKEAGIERAIGVIAVLADDADNLFISLAAREMNPKILIIARGEDSGVEDRILRAGADIVVSPMKLGGRQIAALIREQAGESTTLDGQHSRANVMGLRLSVYRHTDDEPTTLTAVLEQTSAVGIAGVKRYDGSFEPSPQDASVYHGDALVMITRVEETGEAFHKPPTGNTILLADDHRALRLLFSRKLASAGHDVIQASTGDEAIRMARASRPELIVLDVNMPGRNGYEVCETLRTTEEFNEVPIILYSGHETDEFVARGRRSGADLCIRKTSKSSELLEKIEEMFAINRAIVRPLQGGNTQAAFSSSSSHSPTHDESNTDVFDIDVAMENVNGNPELLVELIDVVLEETPVLMERIRLATDPLDHDGLQRAAHTLKGSLLVMGATDATAAAAKLEHVEVGTDLNVITELYADLQNRITSLMEILSKHSHQTSNAVQR